jgi:predicted ester cyclase
MVGRSVGLLARDRRAAMCEATRRLSRPAPWLPALMSAATLAQFAPVTDRLLDLVQIAVMAGFLAVAWFAGRPVAETAEADADADADALATDPSRPPRSDGRGPARDSMRRPATVWLGSRIRTGRMRMSTDDNRDVVAEFVRRCQDQHDLAFADEVFHPRFVNHYRPEGQDIPSNERPASGFQAFYGELLRAFPDATMGIDEQLGERDLVTTRKTMRGTHLGELWDLNPTGNRVEFEFIDIFRVAEGKLIEHWASMDLGALKSQMRTCSRP